MCTAFSLFICGRMDTWAISTFWPEKCCGEHGVRLSDWVTIFGCFLCMYLGVELLSYIIIACLNFEEPSNMCMVSLIINSPHQSGTCVTTDESALTHHYHPKVIVCIRVHSWWCTFYGFGQMCNDVYPPLQCHTEEFHWLKNPLCSSCSSLSPLKPWEPLIFYYLHNFARV